MSKLEQQLAQQIRLLKLPVPETEYRFAAHHVGLQPGIKQRLVDAGLKNWRFDFAFVDHKLAVEVEGGGWVNGRHTRGVGFREDMHKYHHAMRLGWTVYRCEESLIRTGQAVQLIAELLAAIGSAD